jgi:hypothetical protein
MIFIQKIFLANESKAMEKTATVLTLPNFDRIHWNCRMEFSLFQRKQKIGQPFTLTIFR